MPDREIVKSKPHYKRSLVFASLSFVCIFAAVIALIGYLAHRILSKEVREKMDLEAEVAADRIAARVHELLDRQDPGLEIYQIEEQLLEVNQYMNSILTNSGLLMTAQVRDAEGNVVASWSSGPGKNLLSPRRGAAGETITKMIPLRHRATQVVGPSLPGVSRPELSLRVEAPAEWLEGQVADVRGDLIRMLAIGALPMLTLLALAFLYVLRLIRKSRRLEAEAQIADRLAYVGSIASGLAHEIRNPLNAMGVNLQLLEEEVGTAAPERADEARAMIHGAMDEVRRLNRLVSQFLEYARPAPPKLVETDVNRVVHDTLEFLNAELESTRIRVTRAFSDRLPRVAMDAGQIRQALMNILLNAKQVLPEGGWIHVATSVGSRGEVRIAIRDNGPGIAAEDREKIFRIFFSTRGGGTGMGLPIARKILESHGGSIEVETGSGEGACFTLVLPRSRPRSRSNRADLQIAGLVAAEP